MTYTVSVWVSRFKVMGKLIAIGVEGSVNKERCSTNGRRTMMFFDVAISGQTVDTSHVAPPLSRPCASGDQGSGAND
jgi:hypothetical protein